jgi:hypothetical protein
MTNPENETLRTVIMDEFKNWQRQYFHDVYSLYIKGDGQQLVVAIQEWEAGFLKFLQERFPKLVNRYETLATPSLPLAHIAEGIESFKPYKSSQIEAFLTLCIEDAKNGNLDQYYVAPDSLETTSQPTLANEAVKMFICYSHHDKAFAKKLAGELESQGMQVWWDFDNLKGGQDWQKEIEVGIKQCDFFLVTLTPDAVASEWVGNEITYANQAQKTIIPLHLKKCEIPIGLIKKQYIDFEKQTQKSAFKELLEILKSK